MAGGLTVILTVVEFIKTFILKFYFSVSFFIQNRNRIIDGPEMQTRRILNEQSANLPIVWRQTAPYRTFRLWTLIYIAIYNERSN